MKFWQLEAISRWDTVPLLGDELCNPEWAEFKEIFDNYVEIVNKQNRTKLDKIVPHKLVRAVVSKLKLRFVLRGDNLRLAPDGEEGNLSAMEAADRFGGEVIEEVLEKGSFRVPVKSCRRLTDG